MSEHDLDKLERELPALSRVKRFTRTLRGIPWFANLGEPLTAGAEASARAYLDGLGFPHAGVAILIDWDEAASASESLGFQSEAWQAEELLRADLTQRALDLLSEEALHISMTLIAREVAEPAREGMEQAAVIFDFEDEEGKQLAVGAAVQAAHQAALALIAAHDPAFEAERHPFAAKFRLFEFGRWPVGVVGSSFNLF
jgi:hypothetical protein